MELENFTKNWIFSRPCLYRGSYMSARVLLYLLNELGKRDKILALLRILSLFRNEFINSIIHEHECEKILLIIRC